MNKTNKSSNIKHQQDDIRLVYTPCQITKKIMLPMNSIGKHLQQTIENTISKLIEGKCIVEGYVKPKSVQIITFSSGLLKGENVLFDVVLKCEVCYPVTGMKIKCIAKNITKAGIRAESDTDLNSPYVLFIARDHYYASDYFNSVNENDIIVARVIASRFELNDTYVSIIGELVQPRHKI